MADKWLKYSLDNNSDFNMLVDEELCVNEISAQWIDRLDYVSTPSDSSEQLNKTSTNV